jgi:hypothetical protein
MVTDASPATSKPARLAPLTRRLSEPSANVTFAVAPDCTSKAQSSPPESLTSTPASVTFAFLLDAATTMRSRSVCAMPSFMETVTGVSARIRSDELG